MKKHGEDIAAPEPVHVVITRGGGDPLVFQCGTVVDYEEFFDKNPRPLPPTVLVPGGGQSVNEDDSSYLEKRQKWAGQKTSWMILKSLEATEWLSWDTIDMDNPETWESYEDEMKAALFSEHDIVRVIGGIMDANGLSQEMIDKAMESFLAGPQVPEAKQ